MALVDIRGVSFAYDTEPVISEVTLTVDSGQIVSLVGPSGCGKSTLLRLIAGLEVPAAGRVTRNSVTANADRGGLRFLFQDYDAYPWYTVWENVRLGSGPRPHPPSRTVEEILAEVDLLAERDRYPGELSGGMRKRLALARCLVRRPPLLLLDEPFSSLDVDTKYGMYDLVQRLWKDSGCAVVLVTHDLHEAIFLGDYILVSSPQPMKIQAKVEVPFARPRDEGISETAEYMEIRRHLARLLRREI